MVLNGFQVTVAEFDQRTFRCVARYGTEEDPLEAKSQITLNIQREFDPQVKKQVWIPDTRCGCRGPLGENASRTKLTTDGRTDGHNLLYRGFALSKKRRMDLRPRGLAH